MTTPLVSVIIPAYNAAVFIAKTLDSVKAQTFKDYEVIVVDDGSSDGTQAVVEKYFASNKMRGFCILQPNKKIAAARNTGINSARGSYIALLDHDDIWYPEKLKEVVGVFNSRPAIDLVCHDLKIIKNGKTYKVMRCGYRFGNLHKNLILKGNAVTPSSSVFKREKALAIGCFRELPEINTAEDYDFWIRFSKTGNFYFLHKVLSEYHIISGGASTRIEYHLKNTEGLMMEHIRNYVGPSPSWFMQLRIRKRMASLYRSAAKEFLVSKGDSEKINCYITKMMKQYPIGIKNLIIAGWGFLRKIGIKI